MNHRIRYVDIVKGIAICAVVMMHIVYAFPNNSLINVKSLFGYFWHVPLFFVVAGFFINESKLNEPWKFIKNKLKGLYMPALYIYIVAALLHNVLLDVGWYSTEITYGGKMINYLGRTEFVKNIALVIVCAGREPIVGAMWFVYVLLFSLVGFAIVSYLCKKIAKNDRSYEGIRFLVFTLFQMSSCLLTNQFGFTIPRCNNVLSAMLLIYIGQQIYQRLQWKFNNGYVALVCAVFVYQGTLFMGNGSVSFNENGYNDMMQLTIGSVAALYALSYIGRKIENCCVGKLLGYLGSESFYIMCLHIVGFHLCTECLNLIGIIDGGRSAGMTPIVEQFWVLIIYFVFGIVTSLMMMVLWRRIWKSIRWMILTGFCINKYFCK